MDVFKYSDYRKILRDWLANEKKMGRMNASKLAEKLRLHPSFISQVLKDNKDLSAEQWIELCTAMNVSEIEHDYLHFVFLRNRAGTTWARNYYQKKIDEILKRRLQLKERMTGYRQLSDEDRAVFYSSWLYSGVRLYSSIGKGQRVEQISKVFSLTMNRTHEVVDFLLRTGLCVEDDNLIRIGDLHTHVPAGSPFVTRHHTNWRLKAVQALDRTDDDELHFTAPMAISEKDFLTIREKIVRLIQESVETAKNSEAENLAVVCIDLFRPLR